jgi:hypothetical protein
VKLADRYDDNGWVKNPATLTLRINGQPKGILQFWDDGHLLTQEQIRAILAAAEQGSAILRDAVGGFSSGAKAAFEGSLIPTQQRQREFA